MTTPTLTERASDPDLWQLVRQGSAAAFEILVRRHQSVVCSVAYNACGDLSLSEDVAQETFWAAWRERASLEQPGRLRSWLCGIARNLGKNAVRRAPRAAALDAATEVPAEAPGPADDAVSREEESLVWQAIEQIPGSYREPLILFYRENQSVAEVAAALELSEDAVKQRLSRGRGMIRERVAGLVEEGLRRSRPGRGFTVAVMTGLAVHSAGARAALAGAGAAGAVKAGAAVPVGGLLGPLAGLGGGWLGTWLPSQVAPTRRESDHLRRSGRRVFAAGLVFTVVMIALPLTLAGRDPRAYWIAWGVAFVAFQAFVVVASVRAAREAKRLRDEAKPTDEPNDAALRAGLVATAARFRGRVFRSRSTFLGLPLVDINVSDPLPAATGGRRVARGWVAVGDEARGVLLAVGSKAFGLVACGGMAVGVLSFGGVAFGVVAFGGLAAGAVALGGLGVGGLALGGMAVGWQAAGGGAVAWDVAAGGGAAAWHAAFGGGAFAHDYAVGGAAFAAHANDQAARAVLLAHPLARGVEWYAANAALMSVVLVLPALLGSWAMLRLMYRRAVE